MMGTDEFYNNPPPIKVPDPNAMPTLPMSMNNLNDSGIDQSRTFQDLLMEGEGNKGEVNEATITNT